MKLSVEFYPITINVPEHIWTDPVAGEEREVNQLILEKYIEKAVKKKLKKGVMDNKDSFVSIIGSID